MFFKRVFRWLTCLLVVVDSRFLLYESENDRSSPFGFDCLYAYMNDDNNFVNEPFVRNSHLTAYCLRSNIDELTIEDVRGKMIRFDDLKQQGVTSTQLLQWFAPIDIAERYEINADDSNQIFYNCTSPWFGSMCEYTFDLENPSSFADIVNATFHYRARASADVTIDTCYSFVSECNNSDSSVNCLDWREICNGRFECLNGADEQFCEELESSECADGEYRCHYGGQCIPWVFVRDSSKSLDCLDGSDERDHREARTYSLWQTVFYCDTIPTFVCEESTCRYIHSLSCGNGHCTRFDITFFHMNQCLNHRTLRITRHLILSEENLIDFDCR